MQLLSDSPRPSNYGKIRKRKSRKLPYVVPSNIIIPTEYYTHVTPYSWPERNKQEKIRLAKQRLDIEEFKTLFQILRETTGKFSHSIFDSEQFLDLQAPNIMMILNEYIKTKPEISTDEKIKILGLIIAKTFTLYADKYEETIDTDTKTEVLVLIEKYKILKNADWSKMKTKKSVKKSVKKSKKSASKKSLKKSKKSLKKGKKSLKKSKKSLKKSVKKGKKV
jgi:histone H1/5